MAWLDAAPKGASLDKAAEPVSRRRKMLDDGVRLPLPPNPAPFLVEYLYDIGPFVSTGMGHARIGWRDIAAWEGVVGFELPPWQARLIRRLSAEYLAMLDDARKPDCPAPYSGEGDDIAANRDRVAAAVKAMFKGLTGKKRLR